MCAIGFANGVWAAGSTLSHGLWPKNGRRVQVASFVSGFSTAGSNALPGLCPEYTGRVFVGSFVSGSSTASLILYLVDDLAALRDDALSLPLLDEWASSWHLHSLLRLYTSMCLRAVASLALCHCCRERRTWQPFGNKSAHLLLASRRLQYTVHGGI